MNYRCAIILLLALKCFWLDAMNDAHTIDGTRNHNLIVIWDNNPYDPNRHYNSDNPADCPRIDPMVSRLVTALGQQAAPILTTRSTLHEFFWRRFEWNAYQRLIGQGIWSACCGQGRFGQLHHAKPAKAMAHAELYKQLCEIFERYGNIPQHVITSWREGARGRNQDGWPFQELLDSFQKPKPPVKNDEAPSLRTQYGEIFKYTPQGSTESEPRYHQFYDDIEHYVLTHMPLEEHEWRVYEVAEMPYLVLLVPTRYATKYNYKLPAVPLEPIHSMKTWIPSMYTFADTCTSIGIWRDNVFIRPEFWDIALMQCVQLYTGDWSEISPYGRPHFGAEPIEWQPWLASLGFDPAALIPISLTKLEAQVLRNVPHEMPAASNRFPTHIFRQQKDIPWVIHWHGHGSVDNTYFVGMPMERFRVALRFFNNSIAMKFLCYGACFAGGYHTIEPYTNLFNNLLHARAWRKRGRRVYDHCSSISHLNFPIAVESTTDACSHTIDLGSCFFEAFQPAPGYINPLCVNSASKVLSRFGSRIDYNLFFDIWQMEHRLMHDMIRDSLRAVSISYGLEYLTSSDTQLVRFPCNNFFQAVAINNKSYVLTYARAKQHELRNEPIVVTDKKSLLIYPAIIRVPVIIQVPNTHILPDLISMNPEPALHYFTEIDIGHKSYEALFATLSNLKTAVEKFFIFKRVYKDAAERGAEAEVHGLVVRKGKEINGVVPISFAVVRRDRGVASYWCGTFNCATGTINWERTTQQEYTLFVNNTLAMYSARRNALAQLINQLPAPHGRPEVLAPERPAPATRADTHTTEFVAPWQIHHEILKRYVRYQLADFLDPRPLITNDEIACQQVEDRAVGSLAARTVGDRVAREQVLINTEQEQAAAAQLAAHQITIRNADLEVPFYCTVVQRDGEDEPRPLYMAECTPTNPFETVAQRNLRCLISVNADGSDPLELACNIDDLAGRVCDITIARNRLNQLIINPSRVDGSIMETFIQRNYRGGIVIQATPMTGNAPIVYKQPVASPLRIFNKTNFPLFASIVAPDGNKAPKRERRLCRRFDHLDILLALGAQVELVENTNGRSKPRVIRICPGRETMHANRIREIVITDQDNRLVVEAPSYSGINPENIHQYPDHRRIEHANIYEDYPEELNPGDRRVIKPNQQHATVTIDGAPSAGRLRFGSYWENHILYVCVLDLDENDSLYLSIDRRSFAQKACALTINRRANHLIVEPSREGGPNNITPDYITINEDGSVIVRAPAPVAVPAQHPHPPILKTAIIRPVEGTGPLYYALFQVDDRNIPGPLSWVAFDELHPAELSARYLLFFMVSRLPGGLNNRERCAIACHMNTLQNRVCDLTIDNGFVYATHRPDGLPNNFLDIARVNNEMQVVRVCGPDLPFQQEEAGTAPTLFIRNRAGEPLYYAIVDPSLPADAHRNWICLYPEDDIHCPSQQCQILISQNIDGSQPVIANIDTREFLPGEVPALIATIINNELRLITLIKRGITPVVVRQNADGSLALSRDNATVAMDNNYYRQSPSCDVSRAKS